MLKVVLKDIKSLKPYERNARKHSDKQVAKIANSMARFGCNNPILTDKNDTIIAGHGRWAAAKKLGMKEVPTICLDHLSPDEVRAYIIADNKLAELAGWDRDILAIELQHLSSLDLDFDVEITGFDAGEIDFIIGGPVVEKLDPADEVIEPKTEEPAITKRGDLWVLGDHRLYCGDSLDDISYPVLPSCRC